jgi:FkbM family methyltransferase
MWLRDCLARVERSLGRANPLGVGFHTQRVKAVGLGRLVFPKGDTVIAPAIRASGVWEPHELEWLRSHVRTGDVCVNIGANVGYFSCWMSRLTGRSGRVVAVEPNPQLVPLLQTNVRRCALPNVEVVGGAAGSETGSIRLWLNEANFGDSRVFDPRRSDQGGTHVAHGFAEQPKFVTVPCHQLDTLLHNSRIDVVLADAQGWDHHALRGLRDSIAAWRPSILTEFVPGWIRDLGEDPLGVLAEYQSWGYSLGAPALHLPPDPNPQQVLDQIAASGVWFTNLALTPRPGKGLHKGG